MIVRLVRMTFHPAHRDEFLELFDQCSEKIRAMPGCMHLELLQDTRFPNILSTYSLWDDEASLNEYRASDLFQNTWRKTRDYFAAPPEAWSHRSIRSHPARPPSE